MPYIQPQTNNYFGFLPVSAPFGSVPVGLYVVSSSESIINAGDMVMMTTINTVKSVAALTGAVGSPTSSQAYLGVAASPLAALAGSTAATIASNSSQMILVYDDPNQLYVVCDTTSGVIGTSLGQFKNVVVLATGATGSAPSSVLLRSNQALSGATSTAAGSFHVMGLHPIENGIHSTVGAATAGSAVNVRKWIGKIIMTVQTQSTELTTIVNTTS